MNIKNWALPATHSLTTTIGILLVCMPAPARSIDIARTYAEHCAGCHETGIPKAPHSITFLLEPRAPNL